MSTKKTILIVDDDAHIRDFLTVALGKEYSTLIADDGVEALEIYLQNKDAIQCVLTDLLMPRLDGEELIERLHLENPTLPMVLMSALQNNDQMERLRKLPFVSVISKPFHLWQLKASIKLALGEEIDRQ